MVSTEGSPAVSPPNQSSSVRRRTWGLRLGVATVVPVVLLVLLEGALRLGGVGYATRFFVKIEGRDAYTGNHRFGWRFFPRHLSRAPVMIRLPATKAPDVFRVFILGGSAAQGTPEPAFGFGRVLEVMLQDRMPERQVEVVNAAMTAINSHVVRTIARDCARYEPDLCIVYMGNNEVVGPFGPGTVFGSFTPNLWWIRAGLWVGSLRVGQLTKAAARAAHHLQNGASNWRGMAMFTEHRVVATDRRLPKTYRHFGKNLDDILAAVTAAGSKVLVCTVAVNLKDNAPFASLHGRAWKAGQDKDWQTAIDAGVAEETAGQSAEALEQYRSAAMLDHAFADLHFRWARCAYGAGQFEEARRHYLRARDLDALRFRADTEINRLIRERAAGHEDEGVFLLDAERLFEERSEADHMIPGQTFFYDHVHFNFAGNYELGRALTERVVLLRPDIIAQAREYLSRQQCADRLALSGADEYWMAERIWQTTARAPFTFQLDHHERRSWEFERLRSLKRETAGPALEQALLMKRRAVETRPQDLLLRFSLAQLLRQTGRYGEAIAEWRHLLGDLPGNSDLRLELATTFLADGDDQAAFALLEELMAGGDDPADYCDRFGEALYWQGRVQDAIRLFKRGLAYESQHARLHNNLGNAYLHEELFEAARAELQEAVHLSPEDPLFLSNLGAALIRCGRLDEAANNLERSITIDPFDPGARNYMGVVRARQGRFLDAVAEFEEAVRLDPDDAELQRRLAEMKSHARQVER